ncbi:hypothetical protein E2C01_098305 [Portunus trituberculatus]|uniref:Secreted protein n=1 Tax=Portunus trituberculatus TaxID=210409 RepID=A0A5B7K824_PORTR|nr:hypothetical protein [Portunus trituberculatus]
MPHFYLFLPLPFYLYLSRACFPLIPSRPPPGSPLYLCLLFPSTSISHVFIISNLRSPERRKAASVLLACFTPGHTEGGAPRKTQPGGNKDVQSIKA